jgi:hypothetical protein
MNLEGKLIEVGTDAKGLCRAIVQLDPCEVKKVARLPMYARVELVPVPERPAVDPEPTQNPPSTP